MNVLKVVISIGLFVVSFFRTYAQCTPAPPADSVNIIPDRSIYATAQSGNILYMNGNFNVVGNYTGSSIGVDINTSKPVYHNWPLVRGKVNKVLPDGNGGWYIGGEFRKIGDSLRNHIAHIGANGNVSAWNAGLLVGGNTFHHVNDLYIHDSILYVSGRFNTFLGDTAANIAAVNINTGQLAVQQWMTDAEVTEVKIHNNIIYFGGYFQHVNDSARAKLAAYDLVSGQILPWNPDLSYFAYAHVNDIVFVNNRMFVAGDFEIISGVTRNGIAELDLTTGHPTNWLPPIEGAMAHLEERNGFLFLLGKIDSVQNSNFYRQPMLLKIDTSAIPAVDTIISIGKGCFPSDMSLGDRAFSDFAFYGDTIFLSGNFNKINGKPRVGLFAWSFSGDSMISWSCNAGTILEQEGVLDIELHNDRLYLGGEFINIGKYRNGLAAIDMNADTVLNWAPYINHTVINNYGGHWVRQFLIDGNKIYMAGSFDTVNSVRRRSLAALDRFTGDLLPWYPKLSGNYPDPIDTSVNCISLSGNTIYFGGKFYKVNGVIRKGLAAVDTITGLVTRPWNPHTYGAVSLTHFNSILSYDTSIIVGGHFYDIANVQRHNVVKLGRLSGIADPGWHPNVEADYQQGQDVSNVSSMVIDGSYLYLTGHFDRVDSQDTRAIARLRLSDGVLTPWEGHQYYHPNYTWGEATLDLAGNSLYAGADSLFVFDKVSGNEHFSTAFHSPNSGARQFRSLNYYNGKIYVGGTFTNFDVYYNQLAFPAMNNLTRFNIGNVPEVNLAGNNPVCENAPVTFTATTQVQNPAYQWQVNDTNVIATTNQFIYTPQNGDRVKCIVNDPLPSCFYSSVVADEVEMKVVPAGTIPAATLVGPDTICTGDEASYTVSTNVSGGTYQWWVNGMVLGTTSDYYSFFPQSGDNISCLVTTPPLACYTNTTAATDTIYVEEGAVVIPDISLSLGSVSNTGDVVWVVATVNNAPNGFTITWIMNNHIFDVTNGPTTTFVKGSGTDSILAVVRSNAVCYRTDTSDTYANFNTTNIAAVNNGGQITIYPNPFSDKLVVSGLMAKDVLSLYNMQGQLIVTQGALGTKEEVVTDELPNGTYILRITDGKGENKRIVSLVKQE